MSLPLLTFTDRASIDSMAPNLAAHYLASDPDLPVDRPFGFPHILKIDEDMRLAIELRESNLHAADGIATILFKVSPGALKYFLDLNNPRFTFTRLESTRFNLQIDRVSNNVSVSVGPGRALINGSNERI